MKTTKYSLKSKLALSYMLLTFICVASISLLTNFLLDKEFRTYVKENQIQKNKEVVAAIMQQYQTYQKWNQTVIEDIGITALKNGLIIKVLDSNKKVIWDATLHNHGMCQKIIAQMSKNMASRYPSFEGSYVEKIYPVKDSQHQVGTVIIGSYAPFYLNNNDLIFINTLNGIIMFVGVISLVFAFILGTLMAKRLSTPIAHVVNTSQMIAKGFFNDRILEKSNTKEISELTLNINNLASTLQKQELLRKRLTADMAHELRTPLTTLKSHLEAMIDGIWQLDIKRLKSCHEEIIRLNKMVSDLERLAEFEGENLILTKTYFDLSELIKTILQNFEPEFFSKKIKFSFYAEKEELFADRDKISQVLINLLSNALKYTPSEGMVEIKVTSTVEEVILKIKDNGQGIPPEDLAYVFERFYRADKSRNRHTGGSGIGLTIVKAIVEAHHGRIELNSELNHGTEVIVTLPKHKNI